MRTFKIYPLQLSHMQSSIVSCSQPAVRFFSEMCLFYNWQFAVFDPHILPLSRNYCLALLICPSVSLIRVWAPAPAPHTSRPWCSLECSLGLRQTRLIRVLLSAWHSMLPGVNVFVFFFNVSFSRTRTVSVSLCVL